MLNNEKTIRFEDFAAVSQDGGDVLGKVLYGITKVETPL